MREVLAQVLDVLPAERVAAVRAVQDALVGVELDANARSGKRLDRGAEMTQQRFDLAPLDVPADGIVEDRADQVFVLVAHRGGRVPPAGLPTRGPVQLTTILSRQALSLDSRDTARGDGPNRP